MKYIITLSALIIFFFTNSIAEESPPKVTTQQFDNWTYQCVENNKNKNCEVSQTIRIQNTNINFSIAYTKFLNDKQKKIQLISIISPLGIDLKKKLLLRFDDKEEMSIDWASCEQIGCLVFLSNDTSNKENSAIYNKVLKNLIAGKLLEIEVSGYATNQPLIIQSNLKGFQNASTKLNSEN